MDIFLWTVMKKVVVETLIPSVTELVCLTFHMVKVSEIEWSFTAIWYSGVSIANVISKLGIFLGLGFDG